MSNLMDETVKEICSSMLNEPEDDSPDDVWWKWAATGVGASPVEAYNDWVKDWEKYV